MSRSPRGEGVRIGGGRLRVDAARAVTKLREYQLSDPTLWTLEVVRAMVLLGATAIHLEADSDDVWIGYAGTPLPKGELTRLFDDLVSSGPERRAHRLLATGVNTALALAPRFVDVWSIDDAEKTAHRTRYAPHLLRASEEGHSEALRSLVAEEVGRPEVLRALTRGSVVHVKRALGKDTLSRFMRGDVPPEVHRVLGAATMLSIPVHAWPPPLPTPPALISVDVAAARPHRRGRAEILLVERAHGPGRLEWCELGVLLATDVLDLGPKKNDTRVPIVVRLDFDRLPTNAARSSVREGEALVLEAVAEAAAIAKELAATLAEAITQALAQGDVARHHALRSAAIAIVHAYAVGTAPWMSAVRSAPSDAWFSPLLSCPTLRDALGSPRSLREMSRGTEGVVYRGEAALSHELEGGLKGVPWMPLGDPAYALYDTPPEDAAKLIARAEKRAAARVRFLAKPLAQLSAEPRDLMRVTFRAGAIPDDGWLPPDAFSIRSLAGQVALGAVSPHPRQSPRRGDDEPAEEERAEVTFLVFDRAIQRVSFRSAIPFRAMVSASTLSGNPDFTGLLDQDAVAPLVNAASWAAVRAAEAVAAWLGGEATASTATLLAENGPALLGTPRELLEATGRAAQRLAVALVKPHGSRGVLELVTRRGPLANAPLFRSIGGPPLSLAELRTIAQREQVIGTAPMAPSLSSGASSLGGETPVPGRLILSMGSADAAILGTLVRALRHEGPRPQGKRKKGKNKVPTADGAVSSPAVESSVDVREVRVVPYGLELGARSRASGDELAQLLGPMRAALVHDVLEGSPGVRAAFGLLLGDAKPRLILSHAGKLVGEGQPLTDAHLPLGLAVDDDRLIPDEGFEKLQRTDELSAPHYDVAGWCARLAVALADHLLGVPTANLRVLLPEEDALLVAIAALLPDPEEEGDPLGARRQKLLELPVLPRLGGGRHSVAFFRLAGASSLPYVDPARAARIQTQLEGLEAAVLSTSDAIALARLFSLSAVDRTAEAEELASEERRARAWQVFLARSTEPKEGAEAARGTVSLAGSEIVEGHARPVEAAHSALRITTRGRLVVQKTGKDAAKGLAVEVDVTPQLIDIDALDLTETGKSRVMGAVRDASRRLLLFIADDPALLRDQPAWSSLAHAFVDGLPLKRSAPAREVLEVLMDAAAFPTLLGDEASVRAAARDGNEVWMTQGVDGWLAPAEGSRPHALDRQPVLALPEAASPQAEVHWVKLVRAISRELGTLKDVTKEARRLREARRVAASSSGVARLPPWIDRRYAVSLALLAKNSGQGEALMEVLPDGEAALVEEGSTRLILLDSAGDQTLTYSFVPPVFIVARSPYARELDDAEAGQKLEEAARTVVAETLRWTADHVPTATWSPAIRKALRGAALLGGKTHLERLATAALFLTTGGTFVTYDALRDQVNRFGALWVVTDPDVRLVPLDPLRFALILGEHEAPRLHEVLPTTPGLSELRLDEEARRNRARPAVPSIAPSAALLERALTQKLVTWGGGEGPVQEAWVLPLIPSASADRGLIALMERRPLGRAEDPCRWPTLSIVDATFSPNRTHDAPREDEALEAIAAELRQASEALLDEHFRPWLAEPETFPFSIDSDVSRSVLGERSGEVRGVLRWRGVGRKDHPVHLTDALGARAVTLSATPPKSLTPTPVPLAGQLLVSGSDYLGIPESQLDHLARRAYVAVLNGAAQRFRDETAPPEARAIALTVLVESAINLHAAALSGKVLLTIVPFLRRASTLKELMEAVRTQVPVFSLAPHQLDLLDALPKEALVLVKDDTLASQMAHVLLSERTQSVRAWLERDVEREVESDAPVVEAPKVVPQRKAPIETSKKAARPTEPPKVPRARADETLVRHLAALARSVDSTLGPFALDPLRRDPLVQREAQSITVAGESPLLSTLAAATHLWPDALPLLAAEAIAEGGTTTELRAICALLSGLRKE